MGETGKKLDLCTFQAAPGTYFTLSILTPPHDLLSDYPTSINIQPKMDLSVPNTPQASVHRDSSRVIRLVEVTKVDKQTLSH